MEDFLKSLQRSIAERFSSPLLISFAISWCAWNYQFFIIIFRVEDAVEAISLIKSLVFPTPETIKANGFLYPFYSALIYTFVYPIPALAAFGFATGVQEISNWVRNKISSQKLLTAKESQALFEQHRRLEQAMITRNSEHAAEVRALELAIAQLNGSDGPAVTRSGRTKDPGYPNLDENQKKIMIKAAEVGRNTVDSWSEYLDGLSTNQRVKTDYDIELLEKLELINGLNNLSGGVRYSLTNRGRDYYISRLAIDPSSVSSQAKKSPQ